MASNNSSGSSSNRSPRPVLRCYHGEIAPVRVVRYQGPMVGKRFYGCVYWPQTCGFFRWADFDNNEDAGFALLERKSTIDELKQEKKVLVQQNKAMSVEITKLEESLAEISLECEHRREVMCAAQADKRMGYYMVFSWVLFALLFWYKN